MKKYLSIFLLLFLLSGYAFAQRRSIVTDLNTPKSGQGKVKVFQEEAIEGLVAILDTTRVDILLATPTNYTKVKGFKIKVFSGNNAQQSKREAESKQAQIQSAYPAMDTQISFDTPMWQLRVGNFLTRTQAEEVLKEMKKTFPTFAREMYVVSDVIKKPVVE